ncbi:MAG: winged helix-turn-helix domain-containing protein, partial [Victivallaceae bacterium]
MLIENEIALKGAEKVKHEVRNWIRQNRPRPGDRFMSQRELAKLLDVDPMTAHKALSELTDEGILYRLQGKGSFIGNFPREIHTLNLAMAVARPNLDSPVTNSNYWHIVQRVITGVMQSLKDHDTFSTAIIPPQDDPRRTEERLQSY